MAHPSEVATMDFDLGSFFEVENIISAIFNGVPLFPDHKGAQVLLPPVKSAQGSPHESVSSAFTTTLTSTSTSSLGTTIRSESPPLSLSTQSGDDAFKQVRSADMPPPPPPKLDKTPSIYTDSSGQLLLAPDLDMSSAIALSKTLKNKGKRSHETAFGDYDSSVNHSRHLSVDEACQPPEKNLRDELVKLYFIHFHPFCPVVDEVEFMEIYRDIEDDEQLKKRVSMPLFQAMMNVAFSHLPIEKLPSTPFKSIYEGQRAYFEKASFLYRVRYTSDHLILTKLALLLTYWSPFDTEYQVNNYWTDRAFYHARVIRLWDHRGKTAVTSTRCRIIWWCCLLRDRLISIALRCPYRIQEAKSAWPIVSETDFGLEVMFPQFMTVKTKRAVIDSFIWLCKLSDIMRDIAVFHERKRFDREWSDNIIDRATIMPEASRVSQFDSQLRNWREEYLKVSSEYITSLKPGTSKMPNYVLMICDSIFTTVYMPYIHCPPGSSQAAQRFQKIALQRIKEAASATALHCYKTSQASKVGEEFMVGIVAWIAHPMAVFKILEEKGGGEINGRCYEDFVPFLSSLAVRFRPAMLLADIMAEATSEIVERSTTLGIARRDVLRRLPDPYSWEPSNAADRSKNATDTSHSGDEDEAEILSCVAKMVDLHFSVERST